MPEEDAAPPPPEDPTQLMTPPAGDGSIRRQAHAPLRESIGDFEVLEKLGAGGMAAVYRARQRSLDRIVALKVLPAHLVKDAESVARFQREARVAASLSHANLVRVYAAGEAQGVHFIAMELIDGEDLGRRLKRQHKLPPREALRIAREVARGLEHSWQSAQLIHRDIKPANIFLTSEGAVKVGDLGLAKSLESHTTGLTENGMMMGTPHYISPEQARGDKHLDFRADIYSLGRTLFHMLTGEVPYRGSNPVAFLYQHIHAPLPALTRAWPQCPLTLARLVRKMLKKARGERHASYAELIAQIESVWPQIAPLGFNPAVLATPKSGVRPGVPTALHATPQKSMLPLYIATVLVGTALSLCAILLLMEIRANFASGRAPTKGERLRHMKRAGEPAARKSVPPAAAWAPGATPASAGATPTRGASP